MIWALLATLAEPGWLVAGILVGVVLSRTEFHAVSDGTTWTSTTSPSSRLMRSAGW